jgi:hypothetical protein
MTGPHKVLLEKESAIQCNSDKSDILPINRNHSDMVKFREGSEDYTVVANYIHELTECITDTPRVSSKHWVATRRKALSTRRSTSPTDSSQKGAIGVM